MSSSEIILHSTPEGTVKIKVILQEETVWLTQKAMGELFGVVKSTINDTYQIFTKVMNCKRMQLFVNSEQFKLKVVEP